MPDVVGGDHWKQPAFPYHERYVVLLPGGRFALLDPTRSIACTEPTGKWRYTEAEVLAHMGRYHYERIAP